MEALYDKIKFRAACGNCRHADDYGHPEYLNCINKERQKYFKTELPLLEQKEGKCKYWAVQ